jgi:hypothetical protein
MWVILIAGTDSGISVSGSDYYKALIAAIKVMAEGANAIAEDLVDVIAWEEAGIS